MFRQRPRSARKPCGPCASVCDPNSPAETTELLRSLQGQGGDAVIVISDFLTATMKDEIIRTSAELGIAVIAEQKPFVEAGALMFYGADIPICFVRRPPMSSGSSEANTPAIYRSSSRPSSS